MYEPPPRQGRLRPTVADPPDDRLELADDHACAGRFIVDTAGQWPARRDLLHGVCMIEAHWLMLPAFVWRASATCFLSGKMSGLSRHGGKVDQMAISTVVDVHDRSGGQTAGSQLERRDLSERCRQLSIVARNIKRNESTLNIVMAQAEALHRQVTDARADLDEAEAMLQLCAESLIA